ncbi:MAG: hypothetical protein P0Y53_07855 [Candidatus Pseudobacter hemicellulosilyticus]|uniref:Uncharacterized protein n=1 Tax=Candidatus Pseudobacter hemicellulosilyticus TaxID=3121375 RepID=A0AAJ5WXI0_9BACT|nr:MAG: hypothetical protein P0Y53_07855 [Pseudobacter sp.]
MKKIGMAMMAFVLALAVNAQDSDKYTNAMTSTLSRIDSAKNADDFLALSATFERIGDAEKSKWLPYYWASFCQVLGGFTKNVPAENDPLADRAERLISKADSLQKDNSEVAVVRSMIATLRMLVNPMQRWQEFGGEVERQLGLAKKLDPSNPRPYYIQAQNLRNTPEQYGGGCSSAKPVMEEALKKFAVFQPASLLHPKWGLKNTEDLLASCK